MCFFNYWCVLVLVLNVLFLVYVIVVNVLFWFGNMLYIRDLLLLRLIVFMLILFFFNVGVVELFVENIVWCVDVNKISYD